VTALLSAIKLSVNGRYILYLKMSRYIGTKPLLSFHWCDFNGRNIWNGHLLIPFIKKDVWALKSVSGGSNPSIIFHSCQYG
jgi:hypothetical protein